MKTEISSKRLKKTLSSSKDFFNSDEYLRMSFSTRIVLILDSQGVSFMNKIESAVIVSYLLMTCYFFVNWLRFTLRNPSSSPEDKFLSFVMFIISTIFWPIIIPMSCIKIFKTKKIEFSVVVPVLVAVCAFSLAYYMA